MSCEGRPRGPGAIFVTPLLVDSIVKIQENIVERVLYPKRRFRSFLAERCMSIKPAPERNEARETVSLTEAADGEAVVAGEPN